MFSHLVIYLHDTWHMTPSFKKINDSKRCATIPVFGFLLWFLSIEVLSRNKKTKMSNFAIFKWYNVKKLGLFVKINKARKNVTSGKFYKFR